MTIDISTGTGTKTISSDTTIDGGGRGLITVSGGNRVGVFSVNTGVTFTVQNLTIANGSAPNSVGGGILNESGTLTVTNCTFSGNSASPNGGGILNSGALTVTNSTFSGNSASLNGGGILNSGALTVTNSTFSGNSAGNGSGGGIVNLSGTLTVTNSTFSGNSANGAGGGIDNESATLTVTNCTFSGNSASPGGGIDNHGGGVVLLRNTIVANSTDGGNCSGHITEGGHNLDSDGTCGVGPATDPLFAPAGLANNGGSTQTIALQAASPAIDAGDETICAAPPVNNLDQRGYGRPGTGATSCSIGAYEDNSSGAGPTPTPTLTPTVTFTPTPTPTRTPVLCVGDCGGTHTVAVNNLVTLVKIALGTAQPSACPHGVPGGADVNVALLIQAVNNALNGCGVG